MKMIIQFLVPRDFRLRTGTILAGMFVRIFSKLKVGTQNGVFQYKISKKFLFDKN